MADAEGEWNILHHARWGQFDSALNCARHQPGGRDAAMRTEPISEVITPTLKLIKKKNDEL